MNPTPDLSSKLIRIISVILAISLGLNIILFLKRTDVFPSKRKLLTENKTLTQKMYNYKSELTRYKGISLEIDKVVKDANQKIEAKEKEIAKLRMEKNAMQKARDAENQKLVLMADSIMDRYLNVIDSLLVEREKSKAINAKIESLEDIISNLNTRLGYAAYLQADNLKISPVKSSGPGKGQPTAMAKKVGHIQIEFDILANSLSKPGLVNIYVVFTSPNAEILSDSRKSGTLEFFHPDYQKSATCTLTEGFRYNNTKTPVSLQFHPGKELSRGLYIAEVFTRENKLGTVTFSLK